MKKILIIITGFIFSIALVMQMNITLNNSFTLISLDNIEALASGEIDEPGTGTGTEKVQCNPGTVTLSTAFPTKRWCGDCKMHRLVVNGDGHCSKII